MEQLLFNAKSIYYDNLSPYYDKSKDVKYNNTHCNIGYENYTSNKCYNEQYTDCDEDDNHHNNTRNSNNRRCEDDSRGSKYVLEPEHICFNSVNEMVVLDKQNCIHHYDSGYNHMYSFNLCYPYLHIVNMLCDNQDRLHCTAYSNITYVMSMSSNSKLLYTTSLDDLNNKCTTIVSNRNYIVFKYKYKNMFVIYDMNKQSYNSVETDILFEQICCSDTKIYLVTKIWYVTNINIYNFSGQELHTITLYDEVCWNGIIYDDIFYSPTKDNTFTAHCLKTGVELISSPSTTTSSSSSSLTSSTPSSTSLIQLLSKDQVDSCNIYYDNYNNIYCNDYTSINVYRSSQQQISCTYCLVVLFCDNYFIFKPTNITNINNYRFLSIMSKLPIELQMLIIHMMWSSIGQFISSNQFDRYVAYWLL